MTPSLLCPTCRAELPPLSPSAAFLDCAACSARYDVHFGIPDLRLEPLRVAGAAMDRDADLAEATRLHQALSNMSYRDWFFGGVDAQLAELSQPRFRKRMRAYYRMERETFGRHGAAILAKLDAYLAAEEPDRGERWRTGSRVALEAGCGTGQYQLGFIQRFATVLVTDISYVSLVHAKKIAEEHGLAGVHLFASDIARLPLPDGSVDFVHCNGVIEHVSDPARTAAECGRVLSDIGIALVLSPNHFTVLAEPHFSLMAFGFWPPPLRRWLASRTSGMPPSTWGTHLRSLGDLRRYGRAAFAHHRVYFVPTRLPPPVRAGLVRGLLFRLLNSPLRQPIDLLLNRILLPIVPYHVLLGFKR